MTQDECKKLFYELCHEMDKRIKEIDKETPWSEVEPKWWLDMIDLQCDIHKVMEAPAT